MLHPSSGVKATWEIHYLLACLGAMPKPLQTVECAGVVWTMKFSKNGKYLASAGQDAAVRVWEVCLNRGEPRESESEQSFSEAGARYLL